MLDNLNLILGALFNYLTQIWNLYIAGGILTAILVLWLLRKVVRLFDKLK